MIFLISFRDGSRTGRNSVWVLCGEQFETLKRDGSAGVFLNKPIVIGTYPCAPVYAYSEYVDKDFTVAAAIEEEVESTVEYR